MKRFTLGASLVCAFFMASLSTPEAIADETYFNACVSDPPQSAGIYRFSTSGYSPEQIKRNVYASGGGIADDNYYYGVRYEVIGGLPVVERTSYSLKSWSVEDNYPNGNIECVATDVAYFAPTDESYGCFFNSSGTGYVFGKYRLGRFTCEPICNLDVALAALDFDAEGMLYAIDWTGRLVRIDKATGRQTLVGDTGLTTSVITGGAIDRSTGKFYFSVKTDAASALYSVDLTSARATKVYDLENNEQLGGLYFPQTYENAAPAASSAPSLNFNGTALTGTVRFRAPQKSVCGELLTGPVTYHIEANGKEIATGTATYDDGYKSVNVEIDNAGRYCFSLYFSNDAGRGPRSKQSAYIGPDVPKAPESPRMTYKNGVVKLFWSAVGSTGVNQGSIDRSTLYYKIVRYPDKAEFRAEQSGWSQEIAMPEVRTTYYYEISAVAGGLEGAAATTQSFALGTIEPPYEESFSHLNSSIGWSWLNNDSYVDDNYNSNGMRLVTMNCPDEGSYMMTPPMKLRRGHKYEITFNVKRGNSGYEETFEMLAGTEATSTGLNIKLMEPTTLSDNDIHPYTLTFEPEADGIYYLALHATVAARMLYLSHMTVGKGVAAKAPSRVTDMTVDVDPVGQLRATVKFVCPTTNLEGTPLTELTAVDLLRDGEVVKTVTEGVAPGASMIIVDDNGVTRGEHTYSVVPRNTIGEGEPESLTVYVGFNVPLDLEWVKVRETETLGTVEIRWSAADLDIDRKDLTVDEVTYNVYNRDGEQIKTGLTETSIVVKACEPDVPQEWTQYRVTAVNAAGESMPTKSILVPVGQPDKAPWRESWPDKQPSHIIGTTQSSIGDTWSIVGGFSYKDREVDPQDNDGGMMGLDALLTDEPIALFTGKIDLADMAAPAMSFWIFNYVGDNGKDNGNILTIKVYGDNDDDFKTVRTVVIGETGPVGQWNKVSVPLAGYEGQNVRLRIECQIVTSIYVHLDNIEVKTSSECNLTALNLTAPVSVEPDTDFEVAFDVRNTGDADIEAAEATLRRNGEVVATTQLKSLASNDERHVVFTDRLDVADDDMAEYTATVTAPGDLIDSDNTTSSVTVALRRNGYPAPTGLSTVSGEGTIALTWNSPDLTAAPPVIETETFDAAKAWNAVVDGWTFHDLDRATIGGIGTKQLPVSGQQSFFVISDTHQALSDANSGDRFKAHSGHQALWSMYSMRGNTYVRSNDWAVSPRLYGGPQTITLWASSFKSDDGQPQYLESFEILASADGTDIDDFTLIEHIDNVPAGWTRYEFFLPDGTHYFAIRGVSYDKYILMIDDVAFARDGGVPQLLTLSGYRVWRDGVCLTPQPVTTTEYTDNHVTAGTSYAYRVSAVYGASGESVPCESVVGSLDGDGLNSVGATDRVNVVSVGGTIIVTGAAGRRVDVVSVDGRHVATSYGGDVVRFTLADGVYIVTVGHCNYKICNR